MAVTVKVTGVAEFNAALRRADKAAKEKLQAAGREAAGLVASFAEGRIERLSGAAARSIRILSATGATKVSGGDTNTPYFAWLDFGGRVGRKKSVRRRFIKSGRYIVPGYAENQEKINEILTNAVRAAFEQSGIQTDD